MSRADRVSRMTPIFVKSVSELRGCPNINRTATRPSDTRKGWLVTKVWPTREAMLDVMRGYNSDSVSFYKCWKPVVPDLALYTKFFPLLAAMIDDMARDNGVEAIEWITIDTGATLEFLESEARRLTPEEREIMVMGEDRDHQRLVKAKKLQALDAWVLAVFEGPEE